MRNGLVVTVALMMSSWNCVAQSLVPNHSFEEYTQCPWSLFVFNSVVPPWFSGNATSASYFNACDNPQGCQWGMGVPCNNAGYQPARTGNAYAAIALYSAVTSNARNYIEVALTEPLQGDTTYCA